MTSETSHVEPALEGRHHLVEVVPAKCAVEDVQHRSLRELADDLLLVASPTVSSSILPDVEATGVRSETRGQATWLAQADRPPERARHMFS